MIDIVYTKIRTFINLDKKLILIWPDKIVISLDLQSLAKKLLKTQSFA